MNRGKSGPAAERALSLRVCYFGLSVSQKSKVGRFLLTAVFTVTWNIFPPRRAARGEETCSMNVG